MSAAADSRLRTTRFWNSIYLDNTVATMNPDIFVVVEVQSSQGIYGTPVEGNGASGVLQLLRSLRVVNPNWCLVPPLKLNTMVDTRRFQVAANSYTEGIAVFYRSDRLNFQGPWIWPNQQQNYTYRALAPDTPGVQPAAYPPIWQRCLPEGNFFAGQYLFDYPNRTPADFTDWWHRQPWLTRFQEIGRPVNRTINLTSVHLTPSNNVAAKRALALIRECIPGYNVVPPNTVSIIAGDFNLNRNSARTEGNLLDRTNTNADEWLLGPGQSTMYVRIANATPTNYRDPKLLDNAIIRYPTALPQPPLHGIVADIAVGQPAADGMPEVPRAMIRSPLEIQEFFEASGANQTDINANFREPQNFGHIGPTRGLSDHLPFFFKV